MKKKNLRNYEVDKTSKRGVRYIGIYYTLDMSDKEHRRDGLLRIAAGLVEMLLVFIAAAINCVGTRTVYIIIPLELVLFCAMYYVMGAYTFLRSTDRMEQRAYERAVENPVQITMTALVLSIISCIGQAVLIFRKASEVTGYGDCMLLILILVILVLHVMMWKHQRVLYGRTRIVKQEH